jgi:mRNA-degrading endonuclease RelE of RelBE toxin-antitoxin system
MALIIPPDVLRQLKTMPRRDRKRLLEALEMVAAEPDRRFSFTTELVGQPGVWRLRKGDWRAVFRRRGIDLVVDRIGNRRDVYR